MTIPAAAVLLKVPMDPTDRIDYQLDFDETLLEVGEQIVTYTLTMGAEGTALGVSISSATGYAPSIVGGGAIKLWFEVDPTFRENAAFMAGVNIPVVVTLETNNAPPRRWQRTAVLRIIQQ